MGNNTALPHTHRPMGEWDPWASSENADVVMTTVSILFVYNPFWEQTPYITDAFLMLNVQSLT